MRKIDNIPEHYRLIIAVILSTMILVLWQTFFTQHHKTSDSNDDTVSARPHNSLQSQQIHNSYKADESSHQYNRDQKIAHELHDGRRVIIDTPDLYGTINLVGAIIDDVILPQYRESQNMNSKNVALLSPPGIDSNMYTVSFKWTIPNMTTDLPTKNTIWQTDKTKIGVNEAVNLHWINKHGVKFMISIAVKNKYMLSVRQAIEDSGHIITTAVRSHTIIARTIRKNKAEPTNTLIGVVDGALQEVSQDEINDKRKLRYSDDVSWLGIADKYWFVSVIKNSQDRMYNGEILYDAHNSNNGEVSGDVYIDMMCEQSLTTQERDYYTENLLFIGVKELSCLEEYEKQYKIPLFDRAIDFGMLYFLTKPILLLLTYFHKLIGNFGLAILLLTVVVKVALFPLAHKGFTNMNKMKELQPQTQKLREIYKDNAIGLQKAIGEMYKKEKINPITGCLPILLQLPIFISLYKVLSIALEMRFAQFFGWIKDLSAPDPTSVFNLFGMIHWTPPSFLMIGALPLLMGITMLVQQQLNPQPADPTQAKVMRVMPFIMTYMFASFPSGLVLYWTWSNLLSIVQQVIVKKLEKKTMKKEIKRNAITTSK